MSTCGSATGHRPISPLRCYAITDKATGQRNPAGEGMEGVRGNACSAVTCGGRPVAKASEIADAAEVVCHNPNKMSFSSGSEATSASARPRVRG
jgi:hypothetical protein